MGLTSHLSCFSDAFYFYRVFFFNDKSDNDGSGSGSPGTCPFPFSSGNSVGHFSGRGSGVFVLTEIKSIGKMVKCSFPFYDGEMVNYSFPFFDGEMVNCSFSFFDGEMVNFSFSLL